jgi:hypothetical protein
MCDCDPKTNDCITWVSWEDLETVYHLPYSRQHVLERMVPAGHFPKFLRLGEGPKSRIVLRLCQYKRWALERPEIEYPPPVEDADNSAAPGDREQE